MDGWIGFIRFSYAKRYYRLKGDICKNIDLAEIIKSSAKQLSLCYSIEPVNYNTKTYDPI